jgi:anti-sigma-K factor RskA
LAVAAVASAVIGGAVVWAAVDRGGAGTDTTEQFVAQAVLAPLPDKQVSSPGEATVMDSADGQVVRVDARSLPASDGFYEVWLLDEGLTKLVALGALPAGSVGTFTVPPGMSVADYPVVDISLESYDGDPSHSKNSLMRGELKA